MHGGGPIDEGPVDDTGAIDNVTEGVGGDRSGGDLIPAQSRQVLGGG